MFVVHLSKRRGLSLGHPFESALRAKQSGMLLCGESWPSALAPCLKQNSSQRNELFSSTASLFFHSYFVFKTRLCAFL